MITVFLLSGSLFASNRTANIGLDIEQQPFFFVSLLQKKLDKHKNPSEKKENRPKFKGALLKFWLPVSVSRYTNRDTKT
jgi:hypothetical protein